MIGVTGFVSFSGGALLPNGLAFQTGILKADSGLSYTFTGVSVGDISTSRFVHAAVSLFSSEGPNCTVSGLTIGGATALLNVQTSNVATGNFCSGIFTLNHTSSTTATFVVSITGTASNGMYLGVWSSTSIVTAVAHNTKALPNISGGTGSISLTTNNTGYFIFAATNANFNANIMSTGTIRYQVSNPGAYRALGGDGITSGASVTVTSRVIMAGASF